MREWSFYLSTLSDILCQYLGRDDIILSEESRLTSDYQLSSFDLIELVTRIEDTFQIEIADQDIRTLTTAGKLCALIERLTNETSA